MWARYTVGGCSVVSERICTLSDCTPSLHGLLVSINTDDAGRRSGSDDGIRISQRDSRKE
jgi:hypothetical protein